MQDLKFNFIKAESMDGNYILEKHWTLDIYGQDIYTCSYPTLIMDAQVSLFRHLNQQEAISSETIAHPLADGAKKLCKCGCEKEIIPKKWHFYKNNKVINYPKPQQI